MRNITEIIIHCADTPIHMDIGVDQIREWHVGERGWDDVGYHYVIKRAGELEQGREDSIVGAHAMSHNANSLGVCLIGGKSVDNHPEVNYTWNQWKTLKDLCFNLRRTHTHAIIIGHNDVTTLKTCPNFNVKAWVEDLV